MKDRLIEAKKYLIGAGIIDRQLDIARIMDANESSVSRAFVGDKRYLTKNFVYRFNDAFGGIFNEDYILRGQGELLIKENTDTADNSPNDIVNAGDNVRIVGNAAHDLNDKSVGKGRWCPLMPNNVATLPDTDKLDYINGVYSQRMEMIYSGKAPVDFWLQVTDRSLEPYIMQGDYLGLMAYPKGMCNIFPGDVYAIDTRLDGIKVRVVKNGSSEGTLLACSYNKEEFPEQEISKDDIVRVYKKVLMFRY